MKSLKFYIPRQTPAQKEALRNILNNLNLMVGGYTITNGIGVWEGKPERVAVVEVWVQPSLYGYLSEVVSGELNRIGECAMGYVADDVPQISHLTN